MGSLASPLPIEEMREPQLVAHSNFMELGGPRTLALTLLNAPRAVSTEPLPLSTDRPSLKSYF